MFRGRKQIIKAKSQKELTGKLDLYRRYCVREISELQFEEKFVLIQKSETEKELVYFADAVYWDDTWVIVDFKGFKTRSYINKRKLVKKLYPNFKFIEC